MARGERAALRDVSGWRGALGLLQRTDQQLVVWVMAGILGCESIGVDSNIRRWGSGGVLASRCGDAGGRDGQSLGILPGKQSEGVDAQAGRSSME